MLGRKTDKAAWRGPWGQALLVLNLMAVPKDSEVEING